MNLRGHYLNMHEAQVSTANIDELVVNTKPYQYDIREPNISKTLGQIAGEVVTTAPIAEDYNSPPPLMGTSSPALYPHDGHETTMPLFPGAELIRREDKFLSIHPRPVEYVSSNVILRFDLILIID